MEKEEQRFKEILIKYQNGTASEREIAWLETWYTQYRSADQSFPSELEIEATKPLVWAAIQQQTVQKQTEKPAAELWSRLIRIAAVLAIITTAAIYFYLKNTSSSTQSSYANDIIPGTNGATLTLASGKKIILDSASQGQLATQAGVSITKTQEGQLIYTRQETANTSNDNEYNTLSTDKGQTYQVRLPDGSRVWLNAASSLLYPASFQNKSQRRVELSGEAYFEIAKDKDHPFIVKTRKQEVEVLGTHFNISSYPEEAHITTLLEGSIRLSANQNAGPGAFTNSSKAKILKPGQQATVDAVTPGITITDTDAENAIAWKNGLFIFEQEPLESIMKKIARWYNVEISYQNIDPAQRYEGSVSRYDRISKILEKLEQTGGIHFKIEGRRVIIMK